MYPKGPPSPVAACLPWQLCDSEHPSLTSPGMSTSGLREWPVSLGLDFEMDLGPGWIPHLHPSPIAFPFWSWPCPGSGSSLAGCRFAAH